MDEASIYCNANYKDKSLALKDKSIKPKNYNLKKLMTFKDFEIEFLIPLKNEYGKKDIETNIKLDECEMNFPLVII